MVSKYKPLILIIPVHNEEKILKNSISQITKIINKNNIKTSLLFIDDGSNDNTPIILSNSIKKYPKLIKVIRHKKNLGYGSAIKTGIKYGIKNNYKYALAMDSDLTNDPKDIIKFSNEIKKDYDCVKASRYISGGKVKNVPQSRIIISRLGNILASIMFDVGIKDCTNGFMMIKLNIFKNINLREREFAIIMEEMYFLKKKKATFMEIPVILTNRKKGASQFNYSVRTFIDYIKYPIKSIWL